jgi:hypothetical protein
MKKTIISVIILSLGSILLAQNAPDSAKAGKEKKTSVKPAIEKVEIVLPRIAVLDFVSLAGAPTSIVRTLSERLRFHLLESGNCTAIDAGETWKAVNDLQISRADSVTSGQLIMLGIKLKADYIIAGLITDYREGDIEFKQHRLELMGKVYDAKSGQLARMDKVKVKCKKELQAMAEEATEKLGKKLIKYCEI